METTPYPTIHGCVRHLRVMETVNGIRCLGWDDEDPCVPGRIAMFPLLDGWELRDDPCRACGGLGVRLCLGPECTHVDGNVWHGPGCPDDYEDGPIVPDPCPVCRGAGGWPVLYRPCDTCDRTGVVRLVDNPQTFAEEFIAKPCPAEGCVDGMVPVTPLVSPKEAG